MNNPISSRVRGWLYVIAIIVGNVLSSVSAALLILGVDARWQAVASIFLGNTVSTLGILARTNLTADPVSEQPPAPAPAPIPTTTTTIITSPATPSTTEATATGSA